MFIYNATCFTLAAIFRNNTNVLEMSLRPFRIKPNNKVKDLDRLAYGDSLHAQA